MQHVEEEDKREKRHDTLRSNYETGESDDEQPQSAATRSVKHKLHSATPQNKHHKSLSTTTTSASSTAPPSTALTPASSTTALVHRVASHLDQLQTLSQATITTLRTTTASPSLLPTYKAELDAYQADFATAAAELSAPIQQLSSNYSDRLEGAVDECRALSWRVSKSLSQLSSSAAGAASERIHSVYASYRALQTEYDNCLLLAALTNQLHALFAKLQLATIHVTNSQWTEAVDELAAVRVGGKALLACEPHLAASLVYRRMMDEHDELQSAVKGEVMDELRHSVRAFRAEPVRATRAVDFAEPPTDPALDPFIPNSADNLSKQSDSPLLAVVLPDPLSERLLEWRYASEKLSFTLDVVSHLHSAATVWFSSVLAFVGSEGYQRTFTHLHTQIGQQSLEAVGLKGVAWPEVSNGSLPPVADNVTSFDLVPRMLSSCDAVWIAMGQWDGLQALHETVIRLVVQQLLPLTVPGTVTELLGYGAVSQQVQRLCKSLEHRLDDCPPTVRRASPQPLLQWCDDINHHFLRSVRLLALDRCRELLVNNDYQVYHTEERSAVTAAHASYPSLFYPSAVSSAPTATATAASMSSTPTPGPDSTPMVQLLPARLQARVLASYLTSHSPISLHACFYSNTLFELLGQSMHAYTVSPELSSSLFATLCDCLLLVLSIPGVYNSDQLQSVGYMSWLYASDCSFLAVCAERMAAYVVTESRLASVSSTSFFTSISGTAPPSAFASHVAVQLLALVEPLRAVSEHWRRHTLTQLTSAVTTSLDNLPSFTSLDSPTTLRSTVSALQQTIHTLTRSLRSLRDVERPEGRRLIGRRLVERLCDAVVDRVLAVQDVGIEEGRNMEEVLSTVNCTELRDLLGAGAGVAESSMGWRRLEAVQLLIGSEQTLVKIEAEWDAGMLSVLDGVEVSGWIRALYQDSLNRQRLLQKLGGGG